MKYAELSDDQKIGFVKSNYVKIISEIVTDPSKLEKYVPILKEPALLSIGSNMSDAEIKAAKETNTKNQQEYQASKDLVGKIKEVLAGIKPREDCMCSPRCLNIEDCTNMVAPELEPLIDQALKMAETDTY